MPPQGHLVVSETCLIVQTRGEGCDWHLVGVARVAAKHPTVHGTAPNRPHTAKNYRVQISAVPKVRNPELEVPGDLQTWTN